MFLKPFKVKSNRQMKGSERKKIRSEIQKNFPNLSDDNMQQLVPSKDPITEVKIYTHNSISVMVYCTPSIPIVFEVAKKMFPTIYTLWQFPDLLYTYTTWALVVPKLMNGADLMLPGVVLETPYTIKSFGKLDKGTVVSVNITTNKAPVAVGTTALSSLDMYMSAKRGKGVSVLHTIGDHLWFQGKRPLMPELGPPLGFEEKDGEETMIGSGDAPPIIPNNNDDIQRESSSLIDNNLEDESKENSEDEDADVDHDGIASCSDGEDVGEEEDDEEFLEEKCSEVTQAFEELNFETVENPQVEMDSLMKYCFLKAWKTTAKKPTLPLLTSNFFRLHMVLACPTNHTIDIKKSSFKKLSAFLNAMVKEGIIKVKEQIKGVESIVEVDLAHPLLQSFEFWPDDAGEAEQPKTQAAGLQSSAPIIIELYKITANVLPLFKNYGNKKGDALTANTVKLHLTDYVKFNKLQDPDNPRYVKLDPILQDAIQGQNNEDRLTWEQLIQNCLGRMTQTYHLTASGPSQPAAKGKLEPIDIRVGMRSGNKKVTLINNLELFGIVCQEFARKCQHGVAASTSISAVPGKKSAQVLVQGNQVLFVGKLLQEEYKIPKRYIRGLELVPPKKGSNKNKAKPKPKPK